MAPATPSMPQQHQHTQAASTSATNSPHTHNLPHNQTPSHAQFHRPSPTHFPAASPQRPGNGLPSKAVSNLSNPTTPSPLSSNKPAKVSSNGKSRISNGMDQRGSYRDAAHATQDPRRPNAVPVTDDPRRSSAASQSPASEGPRRLSAASQIPASEDPRRLNATGQSPALEDPTRLHTPGQTPAIEDQRRASAFKQSPATESLHSSTISQAPATQGVRSTPIASQPPATQSTRNVPAASHAPVTESARHVSMPSHASATSKAAHPSTPSHAPAASRAPHASTSSHTPAIENARHSSTVSHTPVTESVRQSTTANPSPATESAKSTTVPSQSSTTESAKSTTAASHVAASDDARRSTATNQAPVTEGSTQSSTATPSTAPQPAPATANPSSKAMRIKLKVHAQPSSDQSHDSDQTEPVPVPAAAIPGKTGSSKKDTIPASKLTGPQISPDFSTLSYDNLIQNNRFEKVDRVSVLTTPPEQLSQYITETVEENGLPIILSELHKLPSWDANLFRPGTYERSLTEPSQPVQVRNLSDWRDESMTVEELLDHCRAYKSYGPTDKERLYGRDLACPRPWQDKIATLVHPRLVYHGEEDVAASLNLETRVETQMCYFGSGNTFAPLRRELCSSYGQNLMVWSDAGAGSVWIITRSEDADKVDDFIRASGGDPDAECFAVHPQSLQGLPFPIWCCKQEVGDLVLIPSGATRQVINVHGRTMKVAWSRLSIDTLETALHVDLPMYQRICRKETYRVKAVVEATLRSFTKFLQDAAAASDDDAVADLLLDVRRVLNMYDQILSDEYVPDWKDLKVEGDVDSYVECDFCGADVLLSYMECPSEHTLCSLCYCQGRLCPCEAASALRPRQLYLPFDKRLELRNAAASLIKSFGETDSDQPSIEVMNEKEVKQTSWPHSFMAAYRLYSLRLSVKSEPKQAACKLCNTLVSKTTGYKCKPCHSWFCFGCLLHRTYIHPVHVLAQSNAVQFHNYHQTFSTKDYSEWKENPTVYFIEAQVHFAHIEAGITRTSCAPLNPDCKMGYLDTSPEYPYGFTGTLGRPPAPVKSIKLGKRPLEATQSPASSPQPSSASHKRAKLTPSAETASPKPVSASAGEKKAAAAKTPATPIMGPKGKAAAIIIDDDDSPAPSPSLARKAAIASTEKTAALASGSKNSAKKSADTHTAPSPSVAKNVGVAQRTSAKMAATLIEAGLLPSPEPEEAPLPAAKSKTGPSAAVVTATPESGTVVEEKADTSSLARVSPSVVAHTAASASLISPTQAPSIVRERVNPPTASSPAPNGTPGPIVSSLSTLDSKSLKILTEILGIFSKDVNQRGLDRHQEVVRNLQHGDAKQDELLQEIRGYRAEQQQMLQTMQQLLQGQQEAKAREDERHKEMAAQIVELQDTISDLTGDVTRGAQARIELEKRPAGSNPAKSVDDPSAYLHRTSNVRSK